MRVALLGAALFTAAPTVASAQSSGDVFRWFPSARLGLGAHVPLNGPQSDSAGFSLDLRAGLLAVSRNDARWYFNPELGYAYDGGDRRGGHYFTAGSGLYVGNFMVAVGGSLRGVVGDSRGVFAYGTRESVELSLLATMLVAEVGHQWLRADHEDRHDLRLMVWFNPVPVVLAIMGLSVAAEAVGRGINTAITHPTDLLVPESQRTPR